MSNGHGSSATRKTGTEDTPSDASAFSSDIEIEIFTERLGDHFSITPNELHRGEGDWSGLSGRARNMLSALLTFQSGWRFGRRRIDAIEPKLGRHAIDTILKELKTSRHLFVRRVNAGRGRFTWQWKVYLRPQAEGFSPFPDQRGSDVSAGRTMRGQSGNGRDQQERDVSAGRTIDGSSVDGRLGGHKKEPTIEVPVKEETLSASSQKLGGSATALPRAGRIAKQKIKDPLVEDLAADDAEAVRIASTILDEEDAHLLVDYLRRNRNAATTAGHMRHLDDTNGLDKVIEEAMGWAEVLDAKRDRAYKYMVNTWKWRKEASASIADSLRDALAIGCTEVDLMQAVDVVRDSAAKNDLGAYLKAIGKVTAAREKVRRAERIQRVEEWQQQRDTARAAA